MIQVSIWEALATSASKILRPRSLSAAAPYSRTSSKAYKRRSTHTTVDYFYNSLNGWLSWTAASLSNSDVSLSSGSFNTHIVHKDLFYTCTTPTLNPWPCTHKTYFLMQSTCCQRLYYSKDTFKSFITQKSKATTLYQKLYFGPIFLFLLL